MIITNSKIMMMILVTLVINTLVGMEDQESKNVYFNVNLKKAIIGKSSDDDLTGISSFDFGDKKFEFMSESGDVTIKAAKHGDHIIQFEVNGDPRAYFLGKKNIIKKETGIETGIERLTKVVNDVDCLLTKRKNYIDKAQPKLANYQQISKKFTRYLYGFGLGIVAASWFCFYQKIEMPVVPSLCLSGLCCLGMGYLFTSKKNTDIQIQRLETKIARVMKEPVIRIIEDL